MIAPPTQLYVESNPAPNMAKKPSVGSLGAKLGMTGPLGAKAANIKKSLFGRKPEDASPGGGLSGIFSVDSNKLNA